MPNEEILSKVTKAIDAIINSSDKYEGLFPSLLDLDTHEMIMDMPPTIKGQRIGDRSHLGSNLILDETLLQTMYGLSEAIDRPDYSAVADRYLKRFATHCTDTVTGLFPWGEHAFWHLVEDKIGNSSRYHDPNSTNPAIHDQLRSAPVWLWEKLYEFNPKCVERFAEGLDWHWREREPLEYSRHGEIEVKERPEDYDFCSFDFPRHGGFYILDWAFAYIKTGREDFLRQIQKMMNHWWINRYDDGLLPYCSRTEEKVVAFHMVHACGQTMGYAASLPEAAEIIQDKQPELAAQMREQAGAYANAFVNAPHDLETGKFILGFRPDVPERTSVMPIWGSAYGIWPVASMALLCLSIYRHMGAIKPLQWAEAVGRFYLKEEIPEGIATPAQDAGLALDLLADLYDITGDREWLNGGTRLAYKLIVKYLDKDIPRAAAGVDWYESQMGPGFLLHGLARIALLSDGRDKCPLEADYTTR
ncbi:MAG: hypothetical protein Q7N50_07140 [Armatimonadota bacterium]|nr:hypothetical protein [Armatimonadota bacterium]